MLTFSEKIGLVLGLSYLTVLESDGSPSIRVPKTIKTMIMATITIMNTIVLVSVVLEIFPKVIKIYPTNKFF